jgi:hypothetical protein
MVEGNYTNPTGPSGDGLHIWNMLSTSANYTTANCIEWQNAQFKRAICEVHSELADPDQKQEFEDWYYQNGNVIDLIGSDTLSTGWYVYPGAHLLITAIELYSDWTAYNEDEEVLLLFDTTFEGYYNYSNDDKDGFYEDNAIINIFTPKSLLEMSPFFEEVDF